MVYPRARQRFPVSGKGAGRAHWNECGSDVRPVSYVLILNELAEALAVARHSPEHDVWTTAVLMEERYGTDAMLESTVLAEHLLEEGDCQGAAKWQRIRDAIEWLQAKVPVRGEAVH